MQVPQYSCKINSFRLVLPKLIQLIFLSLLFYVALIINLKLGFDFDVPLYVHVIITIVLILAIVLEILTYHVKFSQHKILFYVDRIVLQKDDSFLPLSFNDIVSSSISRSFFDKIMGTASIRINNKFNIGPISRYQKIYEYFNQLINYYRNQKRIMK